MRLILATVLFCVMGLAWLRAGVYIVDPHVDTWTPFAYVVGGIVALFVAVDQVGRHAEGR